MFVFGSVFTWDLGTFRKTRFRLEPEGNWVFTARAFGKTPIRTFGKLGRGPDGELVLRHRPWLVLPKRELALPPGKYAVGRGLFYSEVIRLEDDASSSTTLTLPPCYRSHEHELSSIYMLAGVHDTGVVRGVKGMWARIRVLLGSRPEPASTV